MTLNPSITPADARELIHALDAARWAGEALGLTLDPWQAGVLRSPSKRLLLRAGRQCGKTLVSALVALHELLFRPRAFVIVLGPSLRQTTEFSRTLAGLLDQLPNAGALVQERAATKIELTNGARLIALTSNEATGRGFAGCTLLVEDEAAYVPDDLHRAIRPTLATTNGRLVLLSTPAGRMGHFYEAAHDATGSWSTWHVPSTECPRISPKFLESERLALGPHAFRREYLAQFGEAEASLFSHDVLATLISDDVRPFFPRYTLAGDEADEEEARDAR